MDTKHAGTKNKISKENKYISGTVKRTETRQTDRQTDRSRCKAARRLRENKGMLIFFPKGAKRKSD